MAKLTSNQLLSLLNLGFPVFWPVAFFFFPPSVSGTTFPNGVWASLYREDDPWPSAGCLCSLLFGP